MNYSKCFNLYFRKWRVFIGGVVEVFVFLYGDSKGKYFLGFCEVGGVYGVLAESIFFG